MGAPARRVLNLREVMKQIMKPSDVSLFVFKLLDLDADDDQRLMYPLRTVARDIATIFDYRHALEFGGRHWEANFTPTATYLERHRTWQSWVALATGLLFTALLEAYLLLVTGRWSRVESIVEERTRQLESANHSVLEHDRMLSAISHVQERYIKSDHTHNLFDGLLAEILALTGSEYGFIGIILRKPDGQPYLKTIAITDISWNEQTRDFYKQNAPTGLEFTNLKTLFGVVVETGEPVITNDPMHDARRGGLPNGHPKMRALLGAPLKCGNELIGMVGIANRAGGYNEEFLSYIEPLLRTSANVIEASINAQKRREIECELAASQELLSEAQRIAHVGHWDWNIRTNDLTWSDETYRINGLEPGTIKPTYAYFVDSAHPDDRTRVLDEIQDTLLENKPYRTEYRLIRPGGEVRWVVGAGELQRDAGGQPLRMVGVVADVTDRKRSE